MKGEPSRSRSLLRLDLPPSFLVVATFVVVVDSSYLSYLSSLLHNNGSYRREEDLLQCASLLLA